MQTKEENIFKDSFLIGNEYSAFLNRIFIEKHEKQDQKMEELTQKVEDLNFKVNMIITDGYNSTEYSKSSVLVRMDNIIQRNLLKDITIEVQKMKELEDIGDQVASCAYICNKMLLLLKEYKELNDNNYCKKLLHLFYQAVKRNYSTCLFHEIQVSIMLNMLEASKNFFVDEETYWEFDEQLYHAGLNVFPEEK